MIRVGVDVGGTFTDFVILSESGMSLHKTSSTPDDPGRAIIRGLEEIGQDLGEVDVLAHGTTVATNAVIQRRGAKTGLLTTRGFRDVLQIRRTTRGELYDFQWDPPAELVPREWRREVAERTNAQGVVSLTPDIGAAVAEAKELANAGVDALAISFINSYVNGANERVVAEAVKEAFPDLQVYVSADILPEWREFERTSTTVVSAYVGPVLSRYLRRLEAVLRDLGYESDLMVMLSSGGLATTEVANSLPAYTLASGPAAGVLAQVALCKAMGIEHLIGMDIGGTSTDISLVHAGAPYRKDEFELEFGTVVSYPVIDIDSVGAGGGTIAWVDEGGLLHVGPQSAGAVPGPACMQRGGTEPTVTDANVLLHRLNPTYLLGGRVPLSEERARAAIAELGRRLDLDPIGMAQGVLDLTTATIVHAIRQRTVERGLDPREFALLAYGGAGPLHAADVAEDLGVSQVIVPTSPGVLSALGLLQADMRHDFVTTVLRLSGEVEPTELCRTFRELSERGLERLNSEGIPRDRMHVLHAMDLRYEGQTHELTVQLPGEYSGAVHSDLPSLLREAHRREFGHAPEGVEEIEIVNLRVACIGELDRPAFPAIMAGPPPLPIEERQVLFGEGWVSTPVFARTDLRSGNRQAGPAIVEQVDSTTVIPPGWECRVDELGSLILRRSD
jgi:N-methylhydantoinase A